MGADAEADKGLLAQAKDNDKISGYLGRWKASLPLSTDGMCRNENLAGFIDHSPWALFVKISTVERQWCWWNKQGK